MVLHGITSDDCNNFELFSLGEITGSFCDVNYCNVIYLSRISSFDERFKVINFMSQSLNSIDLLII